ncbi:hydrolase, NUDIX family [Trichuris suis]|nr:hydrolase, NUDIX family [Trichuris suis]
MSKMYRLYSLVMVRLQDQVLLGLKKKGFGKGKWNGFGGKVEPGETIEQAARRELHEECGLKCSSLTKLGIIRFEFQSDPVMMEVHVFWTSEISGTPAESDEMSPRWFELKNVPFHQMWPDDQIWWPYFLRNQKFQAYFLYDHLQEKLMRHEIAVDS